MSRHMQIDIRLIPFYEKPFIKVFSRIAKLLQKHEYLSPLEQDMSLYELVDIFVDMMHAPSITTEEKERISPFVSRLEYLKETAREELLSRRLNELDKTLYRIEDEFEKLEKSL
ncbi:MAG: hypothetical protein ACQET7_11475 [Thermodesulfobacteriota bacterium]